MNNAFNTPQQKFQHLDELRKWLISNKIDISQWGRTGTKTIENLWEEILSREAEFQITPPLRIISVIQIIIRKGDQVLMEYEQEFYDKQRRLRQSLPSEKMRQGESYKTAALRCLQEELGLDRQDIEIITSSHSQTKEEEDSPSYPGLRTQYILYKIEARVKGLPDDDFWTTEISNTHKDLVTRHHWVWSAD